MYFGVADVADAPDIHFFQPVWLTAEMLADP